MIRKFKKSDLSSIMKIWLESNIEAHGFIPEKYWVDNFEIVREILPQAEIYVYENEDTCEIIGFIGLNEEYIEGIFVENHMRSKGIGKQLLDHVKKIKENISLSVYQKNSRAVSFYQREQFVVQSESMDSDTNEKELVMIWQEDGDEWNK